MTHLADPPLWFFRGFRFHKRVPQAKLSAWKASPLTDIQRWGTLGSVYHDQGGMHVVVVDHGAVALGAQVAGSHRRVVLGRGDLFGTLVPRQGEQPGWIQTLDDTILLRFDREGFNRDVLSCVSEAPQELRSRLRRGSMTVPVSPLLYTGPRERVIKGLLHLFEAYGEAWGGGGAAFKSRMGSRGLARVLGLGQAQVREVLGILEAGRVVERNSGQWRTGDLSALRAMMV